MISGDIQDWQLSASSTYPHEWDRNCHERYARLYQANGRGWCARYKTSSEWLQVDLGVAAKVSDHVTTSATTTQLKQCVFFADENIKNETKAPNYTKSTKPPFTCRHKFLSVQLKPRPH